MGKNNTSAISSSAISSESGTARRFLPLLVLVVVALLFAITIWAYVFIPRIPENIATIEVATQTSGGMVTTNYSPLLAEKVDWDNLSADEREKTARYATEQAISAADKSGVTSFNVLGVTYSGRKAVFLYSGGESLTLFEGDTSRIVSLQE